MLYFGQQVPFDLIRMSMTGPPPISSVPFCIVAMNFRGLLFLCQVVPPQIVIAWLTNRLARMMYPPITT